MNKVIALIIFLVLSVNIFANDTNTTRSAFELFLIKIGITSLVNDFENQKKIVNTNSKSIELLKSDVKYLLQQNIKNKLLVKEDDSSISNSTDELALLKAENERLKKYLQTLENEKVKRIENTKRIKVLEKSIIAKKEIEKQKKAKMPKVKYRVVYLKDADIHKKSSATSKIVRYVKYGDILDIQKCTYYGWCKLKGKKEYIAKYKIKKIK